MAGGLPVDYLFFAAEMQPSAVACLPAGPRDGRGHRNVETTMVDIHVRIISGALSSHIVRIMLSCYHL